MSMRSANFILEGVIEDLETGFLEDARFKLSGILAPLAEDDDPTHIAGKSVAQKSPKWVKVRPSKYDKKPPMKLHFKSLLHKWQEQLESGEAEDTPEALGSFLHRHFGRRDWSHKKVARVAMKAHGKSADFAKSAADHYHSLQQKKPSNASLKERAKNKAVQKAFTNRFLKRG